MPLFPFENPPIVEEHPDAQKQRQGEPVEMAVEIFQLPPSMRRSWMHRIPKDTWMPVTVEIRY